MTDLPPWHWLQFGIVCGLALTCMGYVVCVRLKREADTIELRLRVQRLREAYAKRLVEAEVVGDADDRSNQSDPDALSNTPRADETRAAA